MVDRRRIFAERVGDRFEFAGIRRYGEQDVSRVYADLPAGGLGGVEASSAGGGLRLRNTLRSRLAKAMPEILTEIGRSLGGRDE